jgi:hypothetical protein
MTAQIGGSRAVTGQPGRKSVPLNQDLAVG